MAVRQNIKVLNELKFISEEERERNHNENKYGDVYRGKNKMKSFFDERRL